MNSSLISTSLFPEYLQEDTMYDDLMSTDQTDTDEADDRQKGELYFTFQAIFFSPWITKNFYRESHLTNSWDHI